MVKLSFVVLSLVLAEYISTWRLNSPATNFSTGFCYPTNRGPYSTFNFGLCDLRWFHSACQSIGCSTFSVVNNSVVAIMLMRLSILFDIFSLPQSGPDKHVWSSLNFKWPSWTNSNKKPLATWSPCVNNSTSNGQRKIRLPLRLLNLN